jgi:hypothetical protein
MSNGSEEGLTRQVVDSRVTHDRGNALHLRTAWSMPLPPWELLEGVLTEVLIATTGAETEAGGYGDGSWVRKDPNSVPALAVAREMIALVASEGQAKSVLSLSSPGDYLYHYKRVQASKRDAWAMTSAALRKICERLSSCGFGPNPEVHVQILFPVETAVTLVDDENVVFWFKGEPRLPFQVKGLRVSSTPVDREGKPWSPDDEDGLIKDRRNHQTDMRAT